MDDQDIPVDSPPPYDDDYDAFLLGSMSNHDSPPPPYVPYAETQQFTPPDGQITPSYDPAPPHPGFYYSHVVGPSSVQQPHQQRQVMYAVKISVCRRIFCGWQVFPYLINRTCSVYVCISKSTLYPLIYG